MGSQTRAAGYTSEWTKKLLCWHTEVLRLNRFAQTPIVGLSVPREMYRDMNKYKITYYLPKNSAQQTIIVSASNEWAAKEIFHEMLPDAKLLTWTRVH